MAACGRRITIWTLVTLLAGAASACRDVFAALAATTAAVTACRSCRLAANRCCYTDIRQQDTRLVRTPCRILAAVHVCWWCATLPPICGLAPPLLAAAAWTFSTYPPLPCGCCRAELMTWKPRSMVLHGFLSDAECDHVIQVPQRYRCRLWARRALQLYLQLCLQTGVPLCSCCTHLCDSLQKGALSVLSVRAECCLVVTAWASDRWLSLCLAGRG